LKPTKPDNKAKPRGINLILSSARRGGANYREEQKTKDRSREGSCPQWFKTERGRKTLRHLHGMAPARELGERNQAEQMTLNLETEERRSVVGWGHEKGRVWKAEQACSSQSRTIQNTKEKNQNKKQKKTEALIGQKTKGQLKLNRGEQKKR